MNELKFSVYILDFNWNFLFINQFVHNNLGKRAENAIGSNLWTTLPEIASDPIFKIMKKSIENGAVVNHTTISPINNQRVSVVGYALEDCYYFTSSILPNKQTLIDDLRSELSKKNRSGGA